MCVLEAVLVDLTLKETSLWRLYHVIDRQIHVMPIRDPPTNGDLSEKFDRVFGFCGDRQDGSQ